MDKKDILRILEGKDPEENEDQFLEVQAESPEPAIITKSEPEPEHTMEEIVNLLTDLYRNGTDTATQLFLDKFAIQTLMDLKDEDINEAYDFLVEIAENQEDKGFEPPQ